MKRINKNKVRLKVDAVIYLLNVDDILFCEFTKGKSIIHKFKGNDIELNVSIDVLEKKLKPYSVWKSTSTHLINLKYLVQVSKEQECTVILEGQVHVPIDISRKKLLVEQLSKTIKP